MKHLITYTPRHKEVIDHVVSMALAWHDGDIEPVCEVMFKAFKRHHEVDAVSDAIREFVCDQVSAIRQIDAEGEAFGKHNVLARIQLPDAGETTISEQEAYALESLSDATMRLLVGQVGNCFDGFHIPSMDFEKIDALRKLTDELHRCCWNMPPGRMYGIRYSEESDILFDIHQVLRHERYLNFSEEQKELARWTVLADTPMQTAKEALIRIKTIIENDE